MHTPRRKNGGCNEYELKDIQLKLKVRFICNAIIQYNGMQVSRSKQADLKNIFLPSNIRLSEQSDTSNYFELNLYLVTQEDQNYTAGVIKFSKEELRYSEYKNVKFKIQKCFDNQAFIQFSVHPIENSLKRFQQTNKNTKKIKSKNFGVSYDQFDYSKKNNIFQYERSVPNKTCEFIVTDTKSQFNYQSKNNSFSGKNFHNQVIQNHHPSTTRQKILKSSPYFIPTKNNHQSKDSPNIMKYQFSRQMQDKNSQIEAYKARFTKMKHKCDKEIQNAKEEHQKRLSLENIQQNHKLEIVKYKLKIQQFEKQLTIKTKKIQQLLTQFSTNKNQGQKIKKKAQTMTQNVISLQKEKNHSYQQIQMIKERFTMDCLNLEEQIKQKNETVNKLKKRIGQKEEEIEKINKENEHQVTILQKKLKLFQVQIEKEKANKGSLEEQLQKKIINLQKEMVLLKIQKNNQLEEKQQLLKTLQKKLKKQQSQVEGLKESLQRQKITKMKVEASKKILEERVQNYQYEKGKNINIQTHNHYPTNRQSYKQKQQFYIKSLEESTNLIQKLEQNIEINMKHYEQNINFLNQAIEKLKKKVKNEQKQVQKVKDTKQQVQEELRKVRNQNEKNKKHFDEIIRQIEELKSKEKSSKNHVHKKQIQIRSLNEQILEYKQKIREMNFQIKQNSPKSVHKSQQKHYIENQMSQQFEFYKISQARVHAEQQLLFKRQEKSILQMQNRQLKQRNGILNQQLMIHQRESQKQIEQLKFNLKNKERQCKEVSLKIIEVQHLNQSFNVRFQKQKNLNKILKQKMEKLQQNLKQMNESNAYNQKNKEQLQLKIHKIQSDIIVCQKQKDYLNSQKIKLMKKIDILQDQKSLIQQEWTKVKFDLTQIETNHRADLKKYKQEIKKIESKHIMHRKDQQKFKKSLREMLFSSKIKYLTQNNLELSRLFSKNEPFNEKDIFDSNKNIDLVHLFENHLKQVKDQNEKMFQRYKNSNEQLAALNEEAIKNKNHFHQHQKSMNQQIETLESKCIYLEEAIKDKEEEFFYKSAQLTKQLQAKSKQIYLIQEQNEQKISFFGNINNDSQQEISQLRKQKQNYKKKLIQYTDENQELNYQIFQLESSIEQIESQINHKQSEYDSLCLKSEKNNSKIEDLQEALNKERKKIQEEGEEKKKMKLQIIDLQNEISILKQSQNFNMEEISQQNNTKNQLINGNRILLKEKQQLLQKYLVCCEKITNLESKNEQITEEIQMLRSENEKNKQNLKITKDKHKKDLQELKKIIVNQFQEKQIKLTKIYEELKLKYKKTQTQNINLEQRYLQIQKIYNQMIEKVKQLQQEVEIKTIEMEEKTTFKQCEIQLERQKNATLEKKLYYVSDSFEKYKSELNNDLEQNQELKSNNIEMEKEIRIKDQQIRQLSSTLQKQKQEIEDKDLKVYTMSSEVFSAERNSQLKIDELQQKLQQYELSLLKYDDICEDYIASNEAMRKENYDLKQTIENLDQQIIVEQNAQKKLESNLIDAQKQSKQLQTQLTQKQQQKYTLLSIKNLENKTLTDEIEDLKEILNEKETSTQKIYFENEYLKNVIKTQEEKRETTEQTLKQNKKLFMNQIEGYKKRQLLHKSYKEVMSNLGWNIQRQFKKYEQNFLKNFGDRQNGNVSILQFQEFLRDLQICIISITNYDETK